jgi:phage terminase large subunit
MESSHLKLLPKQEHAVWCLNQPYIREVKYGGAAGGGKSALGSLWINSMCQRYGGSRWLMGRAKLKTLKQTTLNTFFEITSKLNCSNWYDYNQQAGEINYKNGSKIILKDLFLYPSDPEFDSLGSLEVCGGFVDETAQITQKAWQIALSRCRYGLDKFNITPKMLGTCNPTKNYVYKEFYKPSTNGTLPKHRAFIQSLPTDNPHLPQSYLDSLLSLDEISKQRLYYGNWEYDDDPAALMDYNKIIELFTNNFVTGGQKYISADIARLGGDKTVVMVWDGLRVIKIVTVDKSLTTEVIQLIRQLQQQYSVPNSNTICDEDGVGGGVVDGLGCTGFVNNSRPLKEEGIQKNYANLRSQCYFKLADIVNSNNLYISSFDGMVKDLIAEELEQIKQKDIDKDGKLAVVPKDLIKQNIGRSPDYSDCLSMRMYFEIRPTVIRRMRAL